jgi:hypothetical protein
VVILALLICLCKSPESIWLELAVFLRIWGHMVIEAEVFLLPISFLEKIKPAATHPMGMFDLKL